MLARRRLARHFTVCFVVVVGLSCIAPAWIIWRHRRSEEQGADAKLLAAASMLRVQYVHHLAKLPADDLQREVRELAIGARVRLTIVAADGRVLADSEENPSQMRNHADRPELIQAARDGIGRSVRHSSSLNQSMRYIAIRMTDDDLESPFVRASVFEGTSDGESGGVSAWRDVAILAMGALLSAVVAVFLARRTAATVGGPLRELTSATRTMAEGVLSHPVPQAAAPFVDELGDALEQLRTSIAGRWREMGERGEQLATILSGMREGVLAVNHERRILFANPSAQRLLDVDVADPSGRELLELTRCREVNEAAERALVSSEPMELEFEIPGVRPRTLMLRASRLPGDIRFPHEASAGAVLVLHDVTELRRLERLRHELVANVSHELKTPLSSIRAYAETLRLGAIDDPDNNLRFLGIIEQQADQLHQLIQDMLHLARVESGSATLDIVDVDPEPIARKSIEHRAAEAAAKSITIDVCTPETPFRVLADEDGLYTILDNLISNAIRYTPADGRVEVGWKLHGDRGVVYVSDNGIGIALKDQTRVFERFYRVDKARSRELGGTGLGLSIVKHTVQAIGGSVRVESKPGKGSRFEVVLRKARNDSTDP